MKLQEWAAPSGAVASMGCGTSTASHVVPGKAADSAEPSGHSNYEPSKEDKGSNGTASESHNVYKSKRGRRGSISAEVMSPSFFNSPTSSAADLAVVLQAKTGEEREKILFQLRHVIMFAETEDLDLVVDAMQRVQVLKGDVLIKQVRPPLPCPPPSFGPVLCPLTLPSRARETRASISILWVQARFG